jgi:hypothetical protein
VGHARGSTPFACSLDSGFTLGPWKLLQQIVSIPSNIREGAHVLLANTPWLHLHSFCATGVGSGLATGVTLTCESLGCFGKCVTLGWISFWLHFWTAVRDCFSYILNYTPLFYVRDIQSLHEMLLKFYKKTMARWMDVKQSWKALGFRDKLRRTVNVFQRFGKHRGCHLQGEFLIRERSWNGQRSGVLSNRKWPCTFLMCNTVGPFHAPPPSLPIKVCF